MSSSTSKINLDFGLPYNQNAICNGPYLTFCEQIYLLNAIDQEGIMSPRINIANNSVWSLTAAAAEL